MAVGDIILGNGVFSIGGVDVALTRGGGVFTVEREYREIEADGDRGPVKGRIHLDTSRAKLTLNALELLPANVAKMYPATELTSDAGSDTLKGTLDITEDDYQTVTWTGRTKAGRAVIITLNNAINLENPEWTMEDKNEIVAAVTYTATFEEGQQEEEPWSVQWVDDDSI